MPHRVPVKDGDGGEEVGGFKFIVGIQSRKKNTKVVNPWEDLLWIQGQTIYVTVTLSNPLHFPVHIESISLTSDGCSFEAHSYAIVVPPQTSAMTVVLSGKPLEPGTLKIHGCLIRAFNILARHPVNQFGIGVSMYASNSNRKRA